jgi:hypothetical protein
MTNDIKNEIKTVDELNRYLSRHTGTLTYHQEAFTKLVYTDGIKDLTDTLDAYWLISDIGVVVRMKFRNIPFQIWRIVVKDDDSAVLTMREDTNEPVRYRQKYDLVDLPVGTFEFYVMHGSLDGETLELIALLKTEY